MVGGTPASAGQIRNSTVKGRSIGGGMAICKSRLDVVRHLKIPRLWLNCGVSAGMRATVPNVEHAEVLEP